MAKILLNTFSAIEITILTSIRRIFFFLHKKLNYKIIDVLCLLISGLEKNSSKMKRLTGVAAIVSGLVLIGSVQYAFGATVMSIDLGCEWIKVSHSFMIH